MRSALKRLDSAVEALSLIQEEHSLIAEEEEISEYNKTIIEILKDTMSYTSKLTCSAVHMSIRQMKMVVLVLEEWELNWKKNQI